MLSLIGAMTAWAVAMFIVVRDRYDDFMLARYDLGNMVQAVWNTAHGRPLEGTDGTTGEQVVRLAFHVDPILAALAPLWMLVPSPLTLVAVQVAAVSLGALPLYLLARRHSGSDRYAAVVASVYLAYPWIAWAAADAFHPVSLAIPLFLFCFWFLDTDRLVPFAVCAVLAASTGELMALVVASLGVWYALARGRRRAGAVIAAAGVAWTLVAVYVVVPAFSGGPSVYYGAFDDVGGSPSGVIRTAFTDPLAILSAMTRSDDLTYLFLLGAPLAGAFLLAPVVTALATVPILVNLIASAAGTTDPHEHYVSGVLPFLFAATAVGIARLSPVLRLRAAILVLVVSLAATVAVGPWPWTLLGARSWGPLPTSREYINALDGAVSMVPDDAPVSATNRVGSHLAARRYLFAVPVVDRAEWIVLESLDTWTPDLVSGTSKPQSVRELLEQLQLSREWQQVYESHGVFVFRKVV
jgi:uncharacterized membrane protein